MRLLYARRAHMSNIRHVGRNILKGTSAAWSDWVDVDASTTTIYLWLSTEARTELLLDVTSRYMFHIELEFKDVEVLSEEAYWNIRYRFTRKSDGGNFYGGLILKGNAFGAGVYEFASLLNHYTRADAQALGVFMNLVDVKCMVRYRCVKLEVGWEYTGYRP